MKHKLLVKHILNMASASLVCAAIFLGSSGRLDIDTPAVGGTEIGQEAQDPESENGMDGRTGNGRTNNGNNSNGENAISPQNDFTELITKPKS